VLFSEPKIPQIAPRCRQTRPSSAVSVLFSEPKIPQSAGGSGVGNDAQAFQCSSASRKFLKRAVRRPRAPRRASFSALQRAENSSIAVLLRQTMYCDRFSALQRAENSSMIEIVQSASEIAIVSVLFSEPKIPQ